MTENADHVDAARQVVATVFVQEVRQGGPPDAAEFGGADRVEGIAVGRAGAVPDLGEDDGGPLPCDEVEFAAPNAVVAGEQGVTARHEVPQGALLGDFSGRVAGPACHDERNRCSAVGFRVVHPAASHVAKSGAVQRAPAASSVSGGWVVLRAQTRQPARTALCTPATASS